MNKGAKRIAMVVAILFVWMCVALATAMFVGKDKPVDELEEEVTVAAIDALA